MKMIIDIPDTKSSFFEELIGNFSYINIIKIIDDPNKGKQLSEIAQAFNDVRLHEKRQKKLKTAKEFFNEL